jgi:hypothetical protein
MRSHLVIAALVGLCIQFSAHHAFAVGYVQYPADRPPANQTTVYPKTKEGFCDALSRASFANEYPKWLDEVTMAIKDILGQFGLTEMKRP